MCFTTAAGRKLWRGGRTEAVCSCSRPISAALRWRWLGRLSAVQFQRRCCRGEKKKKKSRCSGGWQTWEKNKAEYHKNRVKNEGGERFLLLCMCMRRSWGKDRADAQKSNACFVCLWSRSSKQFFVELWQVRRIMMLAYFRLTWLLLVPSPS